MKTEFKIVVYFINILMKKELARMGQSLHGDAQIYFF